MGIPYKELSDLFYIYMKKHKSPATFTKWESK